MEVENMENEKGNTIPNQFIITDKTKVVFQSYTSKIAECNLITQKIRLFSNMWDYSNTTRKYFKQFINQYCSCGTPTYENKQQWLKVISENKNIVVV